MDRTPGCQTEHSDVRDDHSSFGTKSQHNSRKIEEYYEYAHFNPQQTEKPAGETKELM